MRSYVLTVIFNTTSVNLETVRRGTGSHQHVFFAVRLISDVDSLLLQLLGEKTSSLFVQVISTA